MARERRGLIQTALISLNEKSLSVGEDDNT